MNRPSDFNDTVLVCEVNKVWMDFVFIEADRIVL